MRAGEAVPNTVSNSLVNILDGEMRTFTYKVLIRRIFDGEKDGIWKIRCILQ